MSKPYSILDGLEYAKELPIAPCPDCGTTKWARRTTTRQAQRYAAAPGEEVQLPVAGQLTPKFIEGLWFIVLNRRGDTVTGRLNNEPHFIPGLNRYDEIEFAVENICALSIGH